MIIQRYNIIFKFPNNFNKKLWEKVAKKIWRFDYFVVYPSRQIYNDPVRAKYYGDYGNFRITSYGVECRSLGGYFTDDKYLSWLFDQSMKIFDFCGNPDNIKLLDLVGTPDENTEENYKVLGINLHEKLYENNTVNISVNSLVEETI